MKIGIIAKLIAVKNCIKDTIKTTYGYIKEYLADLKFEQVTNEIFRSSRSNPNTSLSDFTDMLQDYTDDKQAVNRYMEFLKSKITKDIKYYDAYQWVVNSAARTLISPYMLER